MARKTNKAQVLELAARGTARFTVAARNPYRPEPVTLTHSNHS